MTDDGPVSGVNRPPKFFDVAIDPCDHNPFPAEDPRHDAGSVDVGGETVTKEGIELPPGTTPYPKRAAWFQNELALREWSVHTLQAQGGPNWKTSRRILDGLSVTRSVLEKAAAALSTGKRQVHVRDIPQE